MKRAERSAQAERDAKMRAYHAREYVSDVTRATKHVKSINDASEQNGLHTDDHSAFLDDDDDALYW